MKRNLLTLFLLTMACAALGFAGNTTTDNVSQVPEPGSLILLGTAAAGIGYAAWRRNRKE